MPYLLFGFLTVIAVWLFFALAWVVAVLFWPVTLLIAGVLVWRAQKRSSQRLLSDRPAQTGGASGNSAFEAYREETLRDLDEERGRFREFLDRLRRSRDKQEFDAFMARRRSRPAIESPRGSVSLA
jgi:hypothetical protein